MLPEFKSLINGLAENVSLTPVSIQDPSHCWHSMNVNYQAYKFRYQSLFTDGAKPRDQGNT